jgi:Flp pilus assembly protein CpaB
MRSRGLVVAVAVVLAALAAGAVILYTNGVKEEAVSGGELTTVVVATQEIPANTPLNPLIAGGGFKELAVPVDAVVDGAVTSLDELKNRTTTSPLLANEQISAANLDTGEAPAGGALGISKGHLALTFRMNAPQGGFGYIQRGDNVSIFATYNGTSIIPGSIEDVIAGNAPDENARRQELPDFTATIIPSVRVLAVQNPGVDEEGNPQGEDVILTLDLTPEDAQALVFASENALVWVGLLPPGEDGTQPPATQVPVELLLGRRGALA